jgi:hypothetical protein
MLNMLCQLTVRGQDFSIYFLMDSPLNGSKQRPKYHNLNYASKKESRE